MLFALNLLYSAAVSVWHRVSTPCCNIAVFGDFVCDIAVFGKFFCGIAVFRSPQCPPPNGMTWCVVFPKLPRAVPLAVLFYCSQDLQC